MSKKKKKADPAPEYIIERRQYVDDRGRVILGQNLVSGDPPEDFAPYLGHGNIEAEIKTEMGSMKATNQVTFGLEAETIEEAYAMLEARFEEVKAEEVVKMREQVLEQVAQHKSKQSGIILPGQNHGGLPPGLGRRGF